jgi:Dipeptidyl aminopeptidases/acylaminoacyl-peptidases
MTFAAFCSACSTGMTQSQSSSSETVVVARTVEAPSREEIRAAIWKYFGSPPSEEAIDPQPEILEKVDAGDHERWRLRYLVDKEEYGYGYLLLPKPLPTKANPAPLMLALHPTAEIGKDRVVAIYDKLAASEAEESSRRERQYALDLVRRGFITFAPDRAGYGERRLLAEGKYSEQMKEYSKFLAKRHPGFRLTAGKNVWDLQRGLDAIATFDFVDMDRVGTIGHSLGAWDSIMLIAMDDRVKAAVVNSGGMVGYRDELWRDPAALRSYLDDPKQQNLATIANLMLMLAAPRPVLYLWSVQDLYDRRQPNMVDSLREITDYYEQVSGGAKGRAKADFSFVLQPYGHGFPPESQAFAYRWLEVRLNHKPPECIH